MKKTFVFNEEDRWFEDQSLCRLQYRIGTKIVSVLPMKVCEGTADVDAHTEAVAATYETGLEYVGIICLCYPPGLTRDFSPQ